MLNKQHRFRKTKNPISLVSLTPRLTPSEIPSPFEFVSLCVSSASTKQTSTMPRTQSVNTRSISHPLPPSAHCSACPDTPSNPPRTVHKSAICSSVQRASYFSLSSLHSANCLNMKYPTTAITPSKTSPIHFESSIDTPFRSRRTAGFSIMRQERTYQP